MPSASRAPLDQYRDLFDVYDELAIDNRDQLQRTLDRLPEEADPVARLHAAIGVLVGEIAHLKAELSHLRLEVLAHAIPTPPLALREERVVGRPLRSLELDVTGVFAGAGWSAPQWPDGGGPAFRCVHPEAGRGTVELALDRTVPLRAEWVLAGVPADDATNGAVLWVDGAPAEPWLERGGDGEVRLACLLPARPDETAPDIASILGRLTQLSLAFSGGVQRLRVYPS
ncbi:hypothetical protein FBY14_12618 [Azospirillum brasilense]|nr:hypothetical protein FBY14_12618 [Azospirillum brasilense]